MIYAYLVMIGGTAIFTFGPPLIGFIAYRITCAYYGRSPRR